MNKLAKQAARSLYEKYAAVDDDKKYRGSRAYWGYSNIGSLGIPGIIHQRAAQGRANLRGGKGYGPTSEKALRKKIQDPDSDKTYPISRLVTSPGYVGAGGAILGGTAGAMVGGAKAALPLAAAGAALNVGANHIIRAINARATIGQANSGNKGITPLKQKQLKKLKQS